MRHGPARLARLEAELALQGERIDFVDHAVDVVGELVALSGDAFVERYQFASAQRLCGLRCDRKTPLLQLLEQIEVRGEIRAALLHRRDLTQAIGEKSERPLRRNGRVQLAHCAGGGVARVDEGFLAALALGLIQPLEVGTRHVDLAPDKRKGICRMVRMLCVTSSPTSPSPRVAACTNTPAS